MPKPTPFTSIQQQLKTELDGDTEAIAERMNAEMMMGMVKKTEPEFLSLVQRHWHDPAFRQGLHQQFGDQAFVDIWKRAGQPTAGPILPPAGPLPGAGIPQPMQPTQLPPMPPMPVESPQIASQPPAMNPMMGLPPIQGRGVE